MTETSPFLPSRLGFGVSGAHGSPLLSGGDTVRLLCRAARLGVRVFDTAPAYGNGAAERRLGQALAELDRSAVWISTKAGVTGSAIAGRTRDFTPDGIEASLRASLDRLGVEGVDGLFLHGAGAHELTPELFARLDTLRAAGAFVRLGAACRGAELDAALESARFEMVMVPVHPSISEAARDSLARAREAGLAVFAIETAGPAPPAPRLPRRLSDLHGLARAWRERAAPKDAPARLSPTEALTAALADPCVDAALFTTTRRAHLEANAALAAAR